MATKVFGLVGWPIKQSASPAMMNAVFNHLNIDAKYVPFAVEPSRLSQAVEGLVSLGIRGVNVTIPHKQSLIPLVDQMTDVAKFAGAINLVRIDPETGQIQANNSDVIGWWKSVEAHFSPLERPVVTVLGAGGGARGIMTALALYAPSSKINLVARRPEPLADFSQDFGTRLEITPTSWEKRHDAVNASDVVINATPLGMWPDVERSPIDDVECLRAGQIVQDIIYRPLKTKFLSQAESQGAIALDGLWMLVYQGVVALDYWLNVEAPIKVMRQAAEDFLAGSK